MKKILVALDGSERSALVLKEASALARSFGAKLVLYRSVGLPPEVPVGMWRATDLDLGSLLLQNAEKDLKAIANTLPSDLLDCCVAELAVAWDGICSAAQRLNVDLIVIGSHGYAGFDKILGTTASRVVNHADRSVLVVRPHAGSALGQSAGA